MHRSYPNIESRKLQPWHRHYVGYCAREIWHIRRTGPSTWFACTADGPVAHLYARNLGEMSDKLKIREAEKALQARRAARGAADPLNVLRATVNRCIAEGAPVVTERNA